VKVQDFDRNSFEIRNDGRAAFHEESNSNACSECCERKELCNNGEHWIVLNRDYSGYEIADAKFTQKLKHNRNAIETTNELLLWEEDRHRKFVTFVDVEDVNYVPKASVRLSECLIEQPKATSDQPKAKVTAKGNTKKKGRRTSSTKAATDKVPQPAATTPTPWFTLLSAEDPSITGVPSEKKTLIQFYANPLVEELPQCMAVR